MHKYNMLQYNYNNLHNKKEEENPTHIYRENYIHIITIIRIAVALQLLKKQKARAGGFRARNKNRKDLP